ncbi:MAG: hypothetical protein ACR2OC_05240 [Solirubrobacterales bacterium]
MPENANRPTRRRRVLSGAAIFSIAATGAAWSGCGDDQEGEAQDAAEESSQSVDETTDEALQPVEEEVQREILEIAEEANKDAGAPPAP